MRAAPPQDRDALPAPGQAGAAATGAAGAPAGPARVPQPAAAQAKAASPSGDGAAGDSGQAAGVDAARDGGASSGLQDLRSGPGEGRRGGHAGGSGGFLEHLLQSSYERPTPGAGELRHGTEGWRSLETSFWVLPCLLLQEARLVGTN